MTALTHNRSVVDEPSRAELLSMITLALWRLRRSALPLAMTGLGLTCAVMIICTLPLLQLVSTTAALRDLLRSTPTNADIVTEASSRTLGSDWYMGREAALNQPFAEQLAPYLQGSPQSFMQVGNLPPLSPYPLSSVASYTLTGIDMAAATSHLKLIAGRLPKEANGNEMEVAISQQTARELAKTPIGIGTLLRTNLRYQLDPASPEVHYATAELTLRVVGIFDASSANDLYWHDEPLNPVVEGLDPPKALHFPLLLPRQSILHMADQIAQAHTTSTELVMEKSFELTWYRHLNVSTISSQQLSDLNGHLRSLDAAYANHFGSNSLTGLSEVNLLGAVISYYNQPGILERLQNRLTVVNIPIYVVSSAIALLILFFVATMTSLLVEQQTPTIAILRSRGASGRQIFLTLVSQCLLLALSAALLGPLLALLLVTLFAPGLIPTSSMDALNALWPNPLPSLSLTPPFALGTIAISILVMMGALWGALRTNVLDQRYQLARTTSRPFWQRYYLDVVALVIALVAFLIADYISGYTDLLDVSTYLLIISPLRIIAPIFLVISLMLLFLRLFPLLLKGIAHLAQRGNTASPMLAFAQMTRSPQRPLQMLLLLAAACSFTLMSLIFSATQDTHLTDVANYQTMSDFSAQIVSIGQEPLSTTYQRYTPIKGVLSASLGYISDGTISQENTPARLFAVDTATFARTTLWNASNSTQMLSELTRTLATKSTSANLRQGLPAIVDDSTWNQLRLHIGSTFNLQGTATGSLSIRILVIDHVQHIQSLNNNTDPEINYANPLPGGLLVDFTALNRYLAQDSGQITTPNTLWLRTSDNSATLQSIRRALSNPDLSLVNVMDRRALIETLHHDSITLELLGMIMIGTVTALGLALFGNLISTWQSARARLTNFAVLRALGTDARQVSLILLWEQGTIYVSALVLGILFALLLTLMVVPNLVFTTTPVSGESSYLGNAEFYALQHIVPPRLVYPPSLFLALIFFVVICALAIVLMIRAVLRPTLSHMLRLNED
ncbi:FtsX-like permease family protein [Ktedonospora formicarum]|uniref:ABC3 transporter permease C-terminal domain-containing protein n=1 Tax=Ktedonospora formicarum TaxID=2778364 RepID=A0A8J3MSG9_9CHLR|nr:FtsX-like permease family protein [Ktedonospora formicarum]GHO44861.1 hypothetical protein KSX_30240 [Ktedonospora formicarum]